jgi:hypothetical protein
MKCLYGVYRSVCLDADVNGSVLRCHVPQVFADETVTILDVTGGMPDAGEVGWVAFESGFPDRPVWLSAGSGAGGTDEVWIGPSEPGSGVEIWYDTDAPAAGAWTNVTFQNGWTNYGFTNQTVQIRMFGDLVQIRGAMGGGTLNTPAFTLPVGYRPPASTTAILVTGSVNAEGVADIDPTGTVTIFAASNTLIRFPLCQISVTP